MRIITVLAVFMTCGSMLSLIASTAVGEELPWIQGVSSGYYIQRGQELTVDVEVKAEVIDSAGIDYVLLFYSWGEDLYRNRGQGPIQMELVKGDAYHGFYAYTFYNITPIWSSARKWSLSFNYRVEAVSLVGDWSKPFIGDGGWSVEESGPILLMSAMTYVPLILLGLTFGALALVGWTRLHAKMQEDDGLTDTASKLESKKVQ